MTHQTIADSAKHSGLSTGMLEPLCNPLRDRCLAVGPGNAGHPQHIGRMSVNSAGDLTGVRLQIRHSEARHRPFGVPAEIFRVVQYGGGAT